MKREELKQTWDEVWSETAGLLPGRHPKTCGAVGQIPNHLGFSSSAFEQRARVEQEITVMSRLCHSFERQHSQRKRGFTDVLNPLLPGLQSRASNTIRSSLTAVSLLRSRARWQMQAVLGSVSTLQTAQWASVSLWTHSDPAEFYHKCSFHQPPLPSHPTSTPLTTTTQPLRPFALTQLLTQTPVRRLWGVALRTFCYVCVFPGRRQSRRSPEGLA